jgi:hypothetical protein
MYVCMHDARMYIQDDSDSDEDEESDDDDDEEAELLRVFFNIFCLIDTHSFIIPEGKHAIFDLYVGF